MARSNVLLSRIHKIATEKNTRDTYVMYAAEAGVFLLCFDPTLGELQLFHSPSVIGGGIVNPMTFLVALSGIDLKLL